MILMPVYFTFFRVIDFKEMNNQSISKSNMNTNTDEVERTYEGSTRAGVRARTASMRSGPSHVVSNFNLNLQARNWLRESHQSHSIIPESQQGDVLVMVWALALKYLSIIDCRTEQFCNTFRVPLEFSFRPGPKFLPSTPLFYTKIHLRPNESPRISFSLCMWLA